jgi:hypothetical protein
LHSLTWLQALHENNWSIDDLYSDLSWGYGRLLGSTPHHRRWATMLFGIPWPALKQQQKEGRGFARRCVGPTPWGCPSWPCAVPGSGHSVPPQRFRTLVCRRRCPGGSLPSRSVRAGIGCRKAGWETLPTPKVNRQLVAVLQVPWRREPRQRRLVR